jgi:hypothetical protein
MTLSKMTIGKGIEYYYVEYRYLSVTFSYCYADCRYDGHQNDIQQNDIQPNILNCDTHHMHSIYVIQHSDDWQRH